MNYYQPYFTPGMGYRNCMVPTSYKTLEEALALVKQAVSGEREDELFYDYLISEAPTQEEKQIIMSIRDDEIKHNKMYREIYQCFTGHRITAPADIEFKKPKSYIDGIKKALFGELAAMERYRIIRAGMPNRYFRDMVFEILTDELKHADKYNYILNLNLENKGPTERSRYKNTIEKNRTFPEQNPVKVKTKEITYNTRYIIEDLKYPILENISNSQIQYQLNNAFESDVLEFKRQMEEAALENMNEAIQQGETFTPYIVSCIFEPTYNKNNIISISMVYHENLNGRNSFIKVPYNFDITTGKPLSLKDLFKEGVNYKLLVDDAIKKQLQSEESQYFPNTIQNFKGIADDQPFYLDNKNIVIFFGFHEIAPVEAKIPVIKILFSTFANTLKPVLLN